jgi:hypothetical protein
MAKEGETWHLVEARREDGSPTIFRIRELAPRREQTQIFVAELPYPCADGSRLPDAPSYRRFATFEEQWLDPACSALGWTPVAVKIEDGSFFVYLYGSGAPVQLIERLSPFDGALAFFDEADAAWDEYAALRELLDEAKSMPPRSMSMPDEPPASDEPAPGNDHTLKTRAVPAKTRTKANPKTKAKPKAKAKATPKTKAKGQAKAKATPKAKPKRANRR